MEWERDLKFAPGANQLLHQVQIYKGCSPWHGSPMEPSSDVREGLRERKRRETRRRITEKGIELFVAKGYEATTLDAIAEAAGIARRTFFHYFNSKEEIILAWQGALPDAVRAAVLEQGAAVTPLVAVRAALIALAADMRPDMAITIIRIMRSSEQLRAGNQVKFLNMEQAAFEALCVLWPDQARRERLRLVAMLCVGAMRLSIDAWAHEEGQKSLTDHLQAAFAGLDAELGAAAD